MSSEPVSPELTFSPACRALMEAIDLSEDDVRDAERHRNDLMLVPTVPAVLYSIRWLPDGRAIFVSSEITRMEWHVDRSIPKQITYRLALWLRPDLPAGPITPAMPLDQIWARIADSFGVPITCHNDLPRHTRYTARWDGLPPRFTADDPADVVVDGGFDAERHDAKYVWALSRPKYESWLRSMANPTPAAPPDPAALPRTVFARMRPAKLKQPVVVRADIGEAVVRIVCSRCSLRDIHDPPHFHPATKCLQLFGAEVLDPDQVRGVLEGKEYLIPAHFVTDIRTGPAVLLTGDQAPQRSAVLPNEFRPGNRMSLRSIEALLADLTMAE